MTTTFMHLVSRMQGVVSAHMLIYIVVKIQYGRRWSVRTQVRQWDISARRIPVCFPFIITVIISDTIKTSLFSCSNRICKEKVFTPPNLYCSSLTTKNIQVYKLDTMHNKKNHRVNCRWQWTLLSMSTNCCGSHQNH